MRLALRAIAVAAVVAVPVVSASPAVAGPAVCVSYQDHSVYTGPAGTVTVPAPTRVELNCTVQAVLELVQ